MDIDERLPDLFEVRADRQPPPRGGKWQLPGGNSEDVIGFNWPMTACRQRQQWAAFYRSCLLSVQFKSNAIGGLVESKRRVKCNANEWSAPMQSGGEVECNFAPASPAC